jgi:hypothetical protein
MERNEIIDILNGMCERCLMKGIVSTLDEAKSMCEVFNRFRENNYVHDGEYTDDILYLHSLATELHNGGHTSLGESYSIYSAILAADSIDFVETNIEHDSETNVEMVESTVEETIIETEPVKIKRGKNKKSKEDEVVVDISDITPIT